MSARRAELVDEGQLINLIAPVAIPGDASSLIEHLKTSFPSVLRHQRDVPIDALPVPTRPVPWYALAAASVDLSSPPSRSFGFATGDFYLQDAGSLLALAAAGADGDTLSGATVCDLCASPGGKASALVEAVGPAGFVVANEPIRSRVPPLSHNLIRTGSNRWAVHASDPSDLASRLPARFDFVLVDAPCSGQSLVGKGKQRWAAFGDKQIEHSAARQRRILDAAVDLVRPGGVIIYSTCTLASAENEAQVDWLTRRHAGLVRDPVDRLSRWQTDPACYRVWPHQDHCGGAFAARLRVESHSRHRPDGDRCRDGKNSSRHRLQVPRSKGSRSEANSLSDSLHRWYGGAIDLHPIDVRGSVVLQWPADIDADLVAGTIDGPEIAHRTGQIWKPSHAAAIRRAPLELRCRRVRVSRGEAVDYLAGGGIPCQDAGWHVVEHADRPLGWVKASGSVGKNHRPATHRVRVIA